jgi:hypothetical protein
LEHSGAGPTWYANWTLKPPGEAVRISESVAIPLRTWDAHATAHVQIPAIAWSRITFRSFLVRGRIRSRGRHPW